MLKILSEQQLVVVALADGGDGNSSRLNIADALGRVGVFLPTCMLAKSAP